MECKSNVDLILNVCYCISSFPRLYCIFVVWGPTSFKKCPTTPVPQLSGLVLKSQGSPYQPTKNCTAVPPPPHLGAGIISVGFA